MLIKQEDIYADFFWMDYVCSLVNSDIDVPIAACALDGDQRLITSATNATIRKNDPSAHAEVELLRAVSKIYGNHRLVDITVYVNLEPCLMCFGALLQARIKRLVFGCVDHKFGVLSRHSGLYFLGDLNHSFAWQGDVRSQKCSDILRTFFITKRQK